MEIKRRDLNNFLTAYLGHGQAWDSSLFGAFQHVRNAGGDNGFYLGIFDDIRKCVGKHFDHDDRFSAGVFELMLELAIGVQRVGVNHHQPCPKCAEHSHGVLQQVGNLPRQSLKTFGGL